MYVHKYYEHMQSKDKHSDAKFCIMFDINYMEVYMVWYVQIGHFVNRAFNHYFIIFHYTVPTEAPQNVMTVELSHMITLSWERLPPEEENGLVVRYHVFVIETQIHYTDNGAEITGIQTYLNTTYNVSEGRIQLIDGLHPDYNYTVRIAAATESGIGPFSDAVTVRTYMDGKCSFIIIYIH